MEDIITIERLMPRWIERVTTQFGGRDPLGLSRVSNIVTDYLLTGIITTTDRARYYSFYCWALWHIAANEKPRKYQDFVDSFRRREAAMALATFANNPETSPVGVEAVKPRLNTATPGGQVNCNFRVLPSNPLGGYGQYYSGSLYDLRLTFRTDQGIDRVSGGDAETLALLFHDAIKTTPYIKDKLFTETNLRVADLQKTQKYLSLDSLTEPFCAAERLKLIDIFFGFTNTALPEKDLLRRLSLTQILFLAADYEKHGFFANSQDLDWQFVYAPCYYDLLGSIDGWSSPFRPPKELAFCKAMWKQFSLQQYLSQAIESLMCSVLEVVTIESAGLLVEDIIRQMLQTDFYQVLQRVIGKPCNTPRDLLLAFGITDIPTDAESSQAQKEVSLTDRRSECQVLASSRRSPAEMAAQAALTLAVLYLKWRGIKHDRGYEYVQSHAGDELWAKPVLFWMDCWLEPGSSWDNVLRAMVENYVLNQHDRIMYEKGRLDSCWLHRVEGRVLKDQDYSPRWRSSRHSNATRILRDLGLLEEGEEGEISITDEGKSVLKRSLEWHK